MGSLRASIAASAALLISAAGWAEAQPPATEELADDVLVRDGPGPPHGDGEPTTEATDPAPPPPAEPAPPRPPIVPPGGIPNVGGPAPGQRETPAPEPEPPPPIPPPRYSLEVHVRASFPAESSFDRALVALRYRSARVVPTGYVGAQVPLVEWLWIGGRLGIRGMTWRHLERDNASVVAGDLLATLQVRFALGRILEIGVLAAGGIGFMGIDLGGVGSDQAGARFVAEGIVAFRPDAHIAFGPRFGWEYFQWEGMQPYDLGLDIGGPFFGLALEGRE